MPAWLIGRTISSIFSMYLFRGSTMKTNIRWLDNCVSSLPKSVRHVQWTSFERKRFCPYKLHCYQIPVLTRVRFGEGLMVKPEPVTSSHFLWQRWCMLSLFKNCNGVRTLVPRHTIFWLSYSSLSQIAGCAACAARLGE